MSPCLVRPLIALVFAAMAASTASAQPDAGTVFIGVGALAHTEKSPKAESSQPGLLAPNYGGTSAGGTLGIGAFLTSRWSARLEWALAGKIKNSTTVPTSSGVSLTPPPPGVPIFTISTTNRLATERSNKTAFVLIGHHFPPAGRVTVELSGGIGFVNQRTKSIQETSFSGAVPPGLILPAPRSVDTTVTTFRAVAVVGADLAFALTDRAAVVPHVRAYALDSGLSLRPGLGLRWTF